MLKKYGISIKNEKFAKKIYFTVPALGFQIHGFPKVFFFKWEGKYHLKIEKKAKCSSFYLFFREINNSNLLFHCICFTIVQNPWVPETLSKIPWVPRNPWNPC